MKRILVAALGLCAFGLIAQDAQAPAAPAAPMKFTAAKPGPEMEKLKPTLGTWMVEEIHEAGPFGPAGKGHGIGHVTVGPGGLSLDIDYRSTAGYMKGYHGHAMLGWDAESKSYKQTWIDNYAPMVMNATGSWDGDHFVTITEGMMMGKPFKAKDTFTFEGKKGFTIVSEMSMGDAPMQKMMTLVHRHAAAKPAKDEGKQAK